MIIENLVVKFNELVLVILHFWTVPLILVCILKEPADSICIYTDLEILFLLTIDSRRSDCIFNDLEALINIIIGIEESAINTSFKSAQALLGGSNCFLNSLLELDVGLKDIWLLDYLSPFFPLLILYLQLHKLIRIDINNQIKPAEFDLRSRLLAAIQDVYDELGQVFALQGSVALGCRSGIAGRGGRSFFCDFGSVAVEGQGEGL